MDVPTKLRVYELPDWQFLKADFEITEPKRIDRRVRARSTMFPDCLTACGETQPAEITSHGKGVICDNGMRPAMPGSTARVPTIWI